MDDENWKEQYKEWKALKPFQVQLLDEGANTQSQAWLLNSMWSDWMQMKKMKQMDLPDLDMSSNIDPWDE